MDSQPCHGFLGSSRWALPKKVVHCDEEARPEYTSCKAHEFAEHENVLKEKVLLLAEMIRASSNFIAYTGAGISTSSGIGDYASRSAGRQSAVAGMVNKAKTYSAEPSVAHRCLTALYFIGHLKWWCQQNHDGLPQKAGMPQAAMNEIHGSWWDPSNPVVPMSGSLREDLLNELLEWEESADLCLAIGTSLSGMNADRLVHSCGKRARSKLRELRSGGVNERFGPSLGGTVIIGFQCTSLDEYASLRIYAPIDLVMEELAHCMELDFTINNMRNTTIDRLFAHSYRLAQQQLNMPANVADIFYVQGYDAATGIKQSNVQKGFWLDLREGSKVCIKSGCYCGSVGTVMGKSREGNYDLLFKVPAETLSKRQQQRRKHSEKDSNASEKEVGKLSTFPWRTRLGKWMVADILENTASHLVIMNCK